MSASFWGGLWGILFAFVVPRLPGPLSGVLGWILFAAIVVMMLLPPQITSVPTYIVWAKLGLTGTLWPVNEVAACLVGWWLARAIADGATPANAFHGAIYRLRHTVPGDIVEALQQMRPAAT